MFYASLLACISYVSAAKPLTRAPAIGSPKPPNYKGPSSVCVPGRPLKG